MWRMQLLVATIPPPDYYDSGLYWGRTQYKEAISNCLSILTISPAAATMRDIIPGPARPAAKHTSRECGQQIFVQAALRGAGVLTNKLQKSLLIYDLSLAVYPE